jgi:hypothetical protein
MPQLSRPLRVFLSFGGEDRAMAREISKRLVLEGFEPWLDEEQLLPGMQWAEAINGAVRSADVILILLSQHSADKPGYVQREIRLALDLADQKPANSLFLIPVRLDRNAEVPRTLSSIHWVDIFQPDGWQKLLDSLRARRSTSQDRVKLIADAYRLDSLRELFLEEYSIEDLRRLVYESPHLRTFFDASAGTLGKVTLVDRVLALSETESDIEALLDWARKNDSIAYQSHRPYYRERLDPRADADLHAVSGLLDNPYVVGNPIQPENTRVFLGRFDVANAIVAEMRKRGQKPSILLYGRRRMGKTSALLNMQRLVRDPSLINVYVSGQSVRYHTDSDFCFYLSREIRVAFQQALIDTKIIDHLAPLSREAYHSRPLLQLADFFEICDDVLGNNSLHCLIAIDEYEEIDYHMNGLIERGGISRELLVLLRDTLQHRTHFNFLFAGTHYLRDLSAVDWASIFINVKTLHISFLSRGDSIGLLTKPVKGLKYEDDELIDEVLEVTGGQPFLLQAIASEIIDMLNLKGERIATKSLVDAAIEEAVLKHGAYFDFLWDQECEGERRKALIKIVACNLGVRAADVTPYEEELRDLVRRELLCVKGDHIYLTMPILRSWMRRTQHLL